MSLTLENPSSESTAVAAEFPRSVPSSSFFSGLWITDSLNH